MAKKASVLIEELRNHAYDDLFVDIYAEESAKESQTARYIDAIENFISLYGDLDVEVYSAPGRSEVGGNHTDHQFGKVLATSVNIDSIAVVTKTNGKRVEMKSVGYPKLIVNLDSLEINKREYGTSVGLIRGVAAGLYKRGYKIGGFKGFATSQVLSGSGLSSSAAYEILIGNILTGLYNGKTGDSVMLAQIGQEAENQFFGKPSGLMDQMACSVGGLIHIDFADPKNPIVSKVNVDFGSFGQSLCIVDTKGSHADLTGDYAEVPQEMRAVSEFFGKHVLREVSESEFYAKLPEIRKVAGDRGVLRSIHIFNDNKRVDAEKAALESNDYDTFKKLILESGNSSYKYLQNVYSNHKLQEQSVAIGLAMTEQILGDKAVCRVHGGGFAGTIQAFVPHELVETYKAGIEAVFGEGACHVLQIRKYGGLKVLG